MVYNSLIYLSYEMAWTNTDILFISLICQGSEYSPNWLQTEAYPAWHFTWLPWFQWASFCLLVSPLWMYLSIMWLQIPLIPSRQQGNIHKNFFKIHSTESTGLLLPWGISYQSFFRMLSLLTALNKLLLKLSMYLHQILSLTKQELGDPKMLQFIFASLVYKNC